MQQPQPDLKIHVVQTLVLYALCEHQLGHASRIEVHSTNHEFTVSDNGRGHAISRTVEGAPYLDFIYNHLSFPFSRTSSPAVQLQGLGISLINQLCAHLDVIVRKPTETLHMRFQGGQLYRHEVVEENNDVTGNSLSGAILLASRKDSRKDSFLLEWLRGVQSVNPNLELVFNGSGVRSSSSGA